MSFGKPYHATPLSANGSGFSPLGSGFGETKTPLFSTTGTIPLSPSSQTQLPTATKNDQTNLMFHQIDERFNMIEKWISNLTDAIKIMNQNQNQNQNQNPNPAIVQNQKQNNQTDSKDTKCDKKFMIIAILVTNGMMLLLFIAAFVTIIAVVKQITKNVAPFQFNPPPGYSYSQFFQPQQRSPYQ